jgi:hypothetical protein
MTIIVNTGSTLTVTNASPLTITSDSTIAAGGLLDGQGNVTGGFALLNLGTISADVPGGTLSINTGTLTNQGTIFANNESLAIQSSVVLTNLTGGTLTGGVWEADGIGTLAFLTASLVTDAASITLNGTASAITSGNGVVKTIDNSLITIANSGTLNLSGGRNFQAATSLVVNGTLNIGGGTLSAPTNGLTIGATGTIADFGTIDPGTNIVDLGVIEARGGELTLPQAASVSGGGTLKVDPGASLVLQALSGGYAQSIVNNGTIVDSAVPFFSSDLQITGGYSGTGGFLIDGGDAIGTRTILDLPSGLSANVAFDPNFGELLLDDVATFNGTLSGFGNSDTIVMSTVANATSATLTGTHLDLKDILGTVVQTITLNTASMNYTSAVFAVTENVGNTKATVKVSGVQAACFAAGTLIKTAAGEVPVERLVAGDIVCTQFAGTSPVIWIGHRHVDCRRHSEPAKVWPVRVSAHAFGPRTPGRDLLLSPDHAVFVDNVLIPIKHLINGKTIVQEKWEAVTYYHVELAEHDVLLAEGLPAESYLENSDRSVFDNAGGVIALYPDFGVRRWEAFGCAPLVLTGATLDAVATRLNARVPKDWRAGAKSRRVA